MVESVKWSINDQCNLNCSYCLIDTDKGNLSYEEQTMILDKLHREGIKHIDFYGKEPLIDRNIFNLIAYAKHMNYDFKFSIFSNGVTLKEYTNNIINADINYLSLTYNVDEENPYSLDDLMPFSDNTPIEIVLSVYQSGKNSLIDFIKESSNYNIDSLFINPIIGSNYSFSDDQYRNLINDIINYKGKRPYTTIYLPKQYYKLFEEFSDVVIDNAEFRMDDECTSGDTLFIDSEGKVFGCVNICHSKNVEGINYLTTELSEIVKEVKSHGSRMCFI